MPEDADLGQSVITVTARDGDNRTFYYLKEITAPIQVNSLTGQLETSVPTGQGESGRLRNTVKYC